MLSLTTSWQLCCRPELAVLVKWIDGPEPWRSFPGRFEDVINILCVRWYRRYLLSNRDLEDGGARLSWITSPSGRVERHAPLNPPLLRSQPGTARQLRFHNFEDPETDRAGRLFQA
jgi:hypothetical protein